MCHKEKPHTIFQNNLALFLPDEIFPEERIPSGEPSSQSGRFPGIIPQYISPQGEGRGEKGVSPPPLLPYLMETLK
jgi:hypothetical protein